MKARPDRLYIDKSDREKYSDIANISSLFEDKSNKEQFLLAMAFGVHNQTRAALKTKDGWFLEKDLKTENEALISAVAVAEASSVDILSDHAQVYEIAEQYAHAGIRILHDKVHSVEFGTFSKQFEKYVVDIYNQASDS